MLFFSIGIFGVELITRNSLRLTTYLDHASDLKVFLLISSLKLNRNQDHHTKDILRHIC